MKPKPHRDDEDALLFDALVQPRASRARFGPLVGERVKIAVTAPPVDGEANLAVVELVAEALGVRRGAVSIVGGESGRRKTVRVVGATRATLARVLGA